MPVLTPEQEMLKQAALAATPGPWFANKSTEALHAVRGENGRIVADVGYSGSLDRDAENAVYLAAANPAAILALLVQLEATQTVPDGARWKMILKLLSTFMLDYYRLEGQSEEEITSAIDEEISKLETIEAAPGDPSQ